MLNLSSSLSFAQVLQLTQFLQEQTRTRQQSLEMFGQIPAGRSDPFVPDLQAVGLPLLSVSMQQPGTQRGNEVMVMETNQLMCLQNLKSGLEHHQRLGLRLGRTGSQRCWDGASIEVIWEAGLLKLRWSLGMRCASSTKLGLEGLCHACHSLYSKQTESNKALRLDKQSTDQAHCTPGGNLSSCVARCATCADLPDWTKLRCCGRMY